MNQPELYSTTHHQLFRFAGTKLLYTTHINKILAHTDKKIFVEPFLGSGAVFLNSKDFNEYIINDVSKHHMKIWHSVKNCAYADLQEILHDINIKFGSIEHSKSAYYEFRNWFNANIWQSESDYEGLYIMLLYSSCINSLARWGKNGFNQSWGNRLYIPNEHVWNRIQQKLKKTTILNVNGFELLQILNEKHIAFIDPPYFERPGSNYRHTNKNEFVTLIQTLRSNKFEWIYTDMNHDFLNDFSQEVLRNEVISISPLTRTEKSGEEMLWHNILKSHEQKNFKNIFNSAS